MSGMILCRSEYSKRPYYIAAIAANIYSIEEMCYFLYNDIYLVGSDFFCEELFCFIERDIKEPELAKHLRFLKEQKAGLAELVLTILRYVDYYSEKEIEDLGNLIEKLDTQNVWIRLKARADSYLSSRRYNRAISNYEDIIYDKQTKELADDFYGDVWHNMGVAYARMFNFSEASKCFYQAYELNHSEESQKMYFTARQLMPQPEAMNEEESELMYVAGRELETFMDGAVSQDEYEPLLEAFACKEEGRVGDYYDMFDSILKGWQEEYKNFIK